MFAGLGAELPLPTRVVIWMSNTLIRFLPFIVVGIVARRRRVPAVLPHRQAAAT